MRKEFAKILLEKMREDERIFLVIGDLGFGLFDQIRNEFPERVINTGAAEVCMMGVGVGLAMEGKIPFVYSITPFLLWRAAEVIRNYVSKEFIPVKMCGSGRNKDYSHDGWSHDASDDKTFLKCFSDIDCMWPENEQELMFFMNRMVDRDNPSYLNLKR